MDLREFKLNSLGMGINKKDFGKIYSFVDFGNVNYWFRKDRKDFEDNLLNENKRIIVKISKFSEFIDSFSEKKRFYYGIDARREGTWHINRLAKENKFKVISKPIQWIKHYLDNEERNIKQSRELKKDRSGAYIVIPKCNFDVELTIDAIRLIEEYDSFALFSGDSDFSMLLRFLMNNNKKTMLFYSGKISRSLKNYSDLLINAQKIKSMICEIKETKRTPSKGVRKSDPHPRAG